MHREAFGMLGAGADINAMLIFRASSLMFHAKHLQHCVSLDFGAHYDEHLISGFKIFERKDLRLVLLMHTQTSPCIAVSPASCAAALQNKYAQQYARTCQFIIASHVQFSNYQSFRGALALGLTV